MTYAEPKPYVHNPQTHAAETLPIVVEAIRQFGAETAFKGRSAAGDSYYLRIYIGETSALLRISDHPSYTHVGPEFYSIEQLNDCLMQMAMLEVERLGQPPTTKREREDDFLRKFAELRADPNVTKNDIASYFGSSFRDTNERRRRILRGRRATQSGGS